MAGTQIQCEEKKSYRASVTVVAKEGEKEIALTLPEAVPAGQVAVLNIEVIGNLVASSKAPEGKAEVGTVIVPS